MIKTALVYLMKDAHVCLGMKRRGFGEGYWNGYGGKLDADEAVHEAAIREVEEECGVVITQKELTPVTDLEFFFKDGKHMHVTTFLITEWENEPVETEEMTPEWFPAEALPYEKMWRSDQVWLPRVLSGEKIRGKVHFEPDGATVETIDLVVVDAI